MSSLDFEYEPCHFAHEVTLSPLDTVQVTFEVNETLDDVLSEIYDQSEMIF